MMDLGFGWNRRVLVIMAAAFGIATSTVARADWPLARHDGKRTGAATGVSDIVEPIPYWRHPLGGSVGRNGLLVADVTGDAKNDLLALTAGSLVAFDPTGKMLWRTQPLRLEAIDSVSDLDGNGSVEVVARSSDRVSVFAGLTGAIEWAEPWGEMGTIGAVRVADFDGDGLNDVYVQECGCCGASSGKTGFLYTFKNGVSKPKQVWTLAELLCGANWSATVVEMAEPGTAFLQGASEKLRLLDGATGLPLAESSPLGPDVGISQCLGIDIDNEPGEELACVLSYPVQPVGQGHRAFVMKHVQGTPTSLERLWYFDLGDKDYVAVVRPEFVVDLDGDGLLEFVAGGETSTGAAITYVLDAQSGQPLATISDHRFAGTAPIDAGKRPILLTEAQQSLHGWSFSRTPTAHSELRWSMVDRKPIYYVDQLRRARTSLADRVLTIDMNHDGIDDLPTIRSYGGSEILGYASTNTGVELLATYVLPQGLDPTVVVLSPPLTRPYPQALTMRNDGVLIAFDSTLTPTTFGPTGEDGFGLRIGGYYTTGGWRTLTEGPIVGRLGNPPIESVLVVDSRGALSAFDGSEATNAVGAKVLWRHTNTRSPVVLPGEEPTVAFLRLQEPIEVPPVWLVSLARGDGTSVWESKLPAPPLTDLVPGLGPGSLAYLAIQWGHASDSQTHTQTFEAKTGSVLWDNVPEEVTSVTRFPSGFAVGDWDGDGTDDVVHQLYGTRVISGQTGIEVAVGTEQASYFLPTLFDVDSDGVDEVTLHGGFSPARTIRHDLSTQIWVGDDDRPYPYGAIASCTGSPPLLVEGSWAYRSRLKITEIGGASAGKARVMVLADGHIFANESLAGNANQGQLTSVSVHSNLTGKSRPTAVIGSTDGWMYGIDPCAGKLDFSYYFGAAVGSAVFGDTDGDGLDDIVVSVGDGYLYDLRQKVLAPPEWVWDTDPPSGVVDKDVDEIDTTNMLHARWAAVPGADSYEVAVVAQAKYLTTPPWRQVGNTTQTSLPELPLKKDARYRISVRAVMGARRSPDVLSDGVVVGSPTDAGLEPRDEAPDVFDETIEETDDLTSRSETSIGETDSARVEGGGCACSYVAPQPPPQNAVAGVVALLVLCRRRTRRCLAH